MDIVALALTDFYVSALELVWTLSHASQVCIETAEACPEVKCLMYCEAGYEQDEYGCDTCTCIGRHAVWYGLL